MLDCKQVLAELSNYLDGEVSPELKRALEQHLAACHRCSLIFDTTRKTLKIVTDVGPLEVPLEVSARLYARLQLLGRR
jgi:anti-sigma factor (TIGR02949 family)